MSEKSEEELTEEEVQKVDVRYYLCYICDETGVDSHLDVAVNARTAAETFAIDYQLEDGATVNVIPLHEETSEPLDEVYVFPIRLQKVSELN